MAGEIEARLKALGLVLPEAMAAIGSYAHFLHIDRQLFISGQLPLVDGKIAIAGKVGAELDLAKGREPARLCALNILAQAKAALRDLDRSLQLVRLTGCVSSPPGLPH